MLRFPNRSFKLSLIAYTILLTGLTACSKDQTEDAYVDASYARIIPKSQDLNVFFECLEQDGVPLISAHRGGAPENSIQGMINTLSQTPAIMEIDVATTQDGVLFLLHDDTLDRTTNSSGVVSDTQWSEIKNLKLESQEISPPKLSDVLKWTKDKTLIQIDFKRSTRYEDVIQEVKAQKATNRIIYIAYTYGQARKLHRLHPEAMISLTIDEMSDFDEVDQLGIPEDKIIAWTGNKQPNIQVFNALNDSDIEVIFGTLGGADSIDNQIAISGNTKRYVDLSKAGVDIIATDQPIKVYETLKKAGIPVTSERCGVTF